MIHRKVQFKKQGILYDTWNRSERLRVPSKLFYIYYIDINKLVPDFIFINIVLYDRCVVM